VAHSVGWKESMIGEVNSVVAALMCILFSCYVSLTSDLLWLALPANTLLLFVRVCIRRGE